MSNTIIIVTLGCYKRGNYCEALILVPCGSVVCFIADCLPNIQTSGSETIRFFSCGEQTTGIQLAPSVTHVVQKVDGALLHQTTRGQSAGSDPFCFLFVPCDPHPWKSLFLIQISGFVHDKDSNRGILVSQVEVTCNDEY